LRSGPQIGNHAPAQLPNAQGRNCKVVETTASDRSGPTNPQSSYFRIRSPGIFLILAIAIGAYFAGYTVAVYSSEREIKDTRDKNQDLDSRLKSAEEDKIKLKKTIDDQANQIKDLNAKLDETFRPTRTHQIKANTSNVVSIGQFTIGLRGTPRNESVDLNINNKQQTVAAGDVISPQFSTNCRIEVVSFDVLTSSAVINTSCSPASP
jgi:hypothetical protein